MTIRELFSSAIRGVENAWNRILDMELSQIGSFFLNIGLVLASVIAFAIALFAIAVIAKLVVAFASNKFGFHNENESNQSRMYRLGRWLGAYKRKAK